MLWGPAAATPRRWPAAGAAAPAAAASCSRAMPRCAAPRCWRVMAQRLLQAAPLASSAAGTRLGEAARLQMDVAHAFVVLNSNRRRSPRAWRDLAQAAEPSHQARRGRRVSWQRLRNATLLRADRHPSSPNCSRVLLSLSATPLVPPTACGWPAHHTAVGSCAAAGSGGTRWLRSCLTSGWACRLLAAQSCITVQLLLWSMYMFGNG